ncbi:hypothetical protein THARTR1_03816 [Trichoderma harzianum]|uniref:Uncharacterized protein n=1 Tax=Trichoderma harzianum TaxID=5544 RepID=A0A2K0UES4_TRIHA|nr:hypothetical protein THARTR1_03816 [Trichoderma harzianum]
MDALTLVAVVCLLATGFWAWRNLYYWYYSNGLMEFLGQRIMADRAPSGQPLKVLCTNGRFPSVDMQLKGPSIFQLLSFENWTYPDATWAGFYFISSFGVSWALIVMESLRTYNLHNFGSWTTIPGLLMFNHTPAIYLPLYLGVRLALMTPSNVTPSDLAIDPVQLELFPWAFAIGYVAPFIVLLLPDLRIRDISTKQSVAAWWQQWPAYVALCQLLLSLIWRPAVLASPVATETWPQMQSVYMFLFVMAAVSHWLSVFGAFATGVTMTELFLPAFPGKDKKARHGWEAAKWCVQWDVVLDTPAMILWAGVLYWQTGGVMNSSLWQRLLVNFLLAGPLGIPIGLLWERDAFVLVSRAVLQLAIV